MKRHHVDWPDGFDGAFGADAHPISISILGHATGAPPALDPGRSVPPVGLVEPLTPSALDQVLARVRYRNHRGEVAWRSIVPDRVRWDATPWHPEPGWLLEAFDLVKGARRSFALSGVLEWRDGLPALEKRYARDAEGETDAWRERIETGDPWEVAVDATSDLSEELHFAGWRSGAGVAVQRIAAGESVPGWSWPGASSPLTRGAYIDAADLPRLARLLDRLGGWWVEHPDDHRGRYVALPPVGRTP